MKFLRAGLRSERTVVPNYDFPSATLPEEAHHPLFLTESLDGRASVGIAARDFECIFNNNDYILRCLHSEPRPLPPIPPGARATQEGAILFCDGTGETLRAKFDTLFPDWL